MRPARKLPALAVVVTSVALLAGCGSSSSVQSTERAQPPPAAQTSTTPPGATAKACDTYAVDATVLRASGVSCGDARRVMYGWQSAEGCSKQAGASRNACVVRGFHCLGATTARGVAVSCATEGRSISFIAKRR